MVKTVAAAVVAGQIGQAIGDTVQRAMSFESAMADVAKTVDGLKDANGKATQAYAEMSKELLDMTAYLPMTGEELATITAAAGQAGIAAQDLTKFTETAAKMGVAFDVTADQSGEWMAQWRTAFKMSQSEVTTLADQINYLSNTSSENAIKLSGVVSRIGSLGEISGVSAAEIAAMAAGMTGVTEEISATGIKNLMKAMNAGNAASKSQIKVLDRLGFSATTMAKSMQNDATGAILDLLGAFKELPEAEQSAAITQYFGSESVAAIAPLISNLDNLKIQFEKVGDASLYAESMEKEFASRSATTENKVQLAKNAIDRMQISLGNLFLPAVAVGANIFADTLNNITSAMPQAIAGIKDFGAHILNSIAGTDTQKIYEHLRPKLPIIADCAKYTAKNLIYGIGKFLKGENLSSAMGESMSGIKGILNQVLGEKGLLLFSSLENRINAVSGLIEEVKPVFTKAFDVLKTRGMPILEMIFSKGNEVFSNIAKVISDIIPIVEKIVESLFPKILSVFETVIPIVSNIINSSLEKISGLLNFISNNWSILEPIIIGVGAAIAAWKIGSVVVDTTKAVFEFGAEIISLPGKLSKATLAQIALTKAKFLDRMETLYLKSLYAKDFILSIFSSTKAIVIQTGAWIANKVQMGLQVAGMLALKAAQVISTGVTAAMTAAQWALNAAFIASPIGWIVLAIGALIAVGVLLYKNWDTVKAVALSLWATISTVFANIVTSISETFNNVMSYLNDNFPMIASIIENTFGSVGSIIDNLKLAFGGIIDFITGIFTGNWEKAWQGVKNIFGGIFGTLGELLKMPLNTIITLINSAIGGINKLGINVPDWIPVIGGKSFSINIPEIPMLAKGSNYTPDTFIAGEKGAELITNAKGRKVFNAFETGNIFKNIGNLYSDSSTVKGKSGKSKVESFGARLERAASNFKADIKVTMPNINIYGNVSNEQLSDLYNKLEEYKSEMESLLRKLIRDEDNRRRRVSYE